MIGVVFPEKKVFMTKEILINNKKKNKYGITHTSLDIPRAEGLERLCQMRHGELGRVPQLVAELPVGVDAKHVQVDVATCTIFGFS